MQRISPGTEINAYMPYLACMRNHRCKGPGGVRIPIRHLWQYR